MPKTRLALYCLQETAEHHCGTPCNDIITSTSANNAYVPSSKSSTAMLTIFHLPHQQHFITTNFYLLPTSVTFTMKTYTSTLLLLASTEVAYGHSAKSTKPEMSASMSVEFAYTKSAKSKEPIRRLLVNDPR